MKKRILCLLAALLLCFSMVLVSCDNTEDNGDDTPSTNDEGKKGEIIVQGAAGDANISVDGKPTDGYTIPN